MYPDIYEETFQKSKKGVQYILDERSGLAGCSGEYECSLYSRSASSFALGRAVLCSGSEGYKCPHGSWGVCLPGLWSWKFKACACMDSQQLQTLGRSHSFCPRMKYENA